MELSVQPWMLSVESIHQAYFFHVTIKMDAHKLNLAIFSQKKLNLAIPGLNFI
jgi:hypothetical protein